MEVGDWHGTEEIEVEHNENILGFSSEWVRVELVG